MPTNKTLIFIKILHTLIWAVMAPATLYILYAGITGTFNGWLWAAIGLLLVESIVLILNKWTCPLTPWAMKYTEDRRDNFDIYLPQLAAKYNKVIFGTILVAGLILVAFNVVIGRGSM